MMQQNRDFTQDDDERLNPCNQISISNALKSIVNPVKACWHMHNVIKNLIKDIELKRKEMDDSGNFPNKSHQNNIL